jgi:hypothetical protein
MQHNLRLTMKGLPNLAGATAVLLLVLNLTGCEPRSYGLVVESVDNYPVAPLTNSVANGDGFIQGMTVAGSPWELKTKLTNGAVWDRDLTDGDIARTGIDHLYFDQPGVAISYFTGHGITTHGCSTQQCSTTAACTTPVAGARLPETCRFSPLDNPRCCYMVDRMAVTSGTSDANGGFINYTSGPIRWGESTNSGAWAGAGTNGGTNLVVLDISHGILPIFWYQTLRNASAGVHMIATLMTAGGDTANSAIRGSTFARMWAANPNGNTAQAWLDTMSSLPATDQFNGFGCNIVVAMDSTPQDAASKMNEDWIDLRSDNRDAKGNNWYSARWQCNYTLSSTSQSAWELP